VEDNIASLQKQNNKFLFAMQMTFGSEMTQFCNSQGSILRESHDGLRLITDSNLQTLKILFQSISLFGLNLNQIQPI
jgi:hypothetical protein